jgi:hypothetical protein
MSESEYGFIARPFEDSFRYPMRGRKPEWQRLKELIETALREHGTKTILVIGDYGYGKSFTLEKIAAAFSGSRKAIFASIRLAESEPEARIGLSLVTKIFYQIGRERLVHIASKISTRNIGSLQTELRSALRALKHVDTCEIGYRFLIGESLAPDEKKKIGVRKILSSSRVAIGILYDFQKALKSAGYDNLVLLIDEFEYVVNVYSEKQVTTILHTFKEIYDEYIREELRGVEMANFIFIIAMTPRGWDYLTETEAKLARKTGGGGITPWMERIRSEWNRVDLEPLSKPDVVNLIQDRIEENRKEYFKPPFKTFPFIHPEFFDVIYDASEGVPRYVVQYSDLILKEAFRERLKEISGDAARQVLQRFDVLPQKPLETSGKKKAGRDRPERGLAGETAASVQPDESGRGV